ncbi:MAG: hypothetical protein EZS28_032588 [Streblomastix strix]|uniref:Uncharacterized protein n=1 Tax=Streblomastix strix TaxID=222440 RepID=A0A5J4UNY3_9EUKA|nr:MAG: hypothetical protein EZS28_032588 [Streblomastix strix]
MADRDLHMLDVVLKHDEALFGSNRTNTIGIVEQITNINNQINNISNGAIGDTYSKTETDGLLDEKADKSDLDEYYTKSETYAKLEVYNKTEVDEFLDEKANVSASYSKSEDDALPLLKADKTQLIDSYCKSEDDALLLLKADKTELIDSYTKTETDNLLNDKANQSTTYTKTETDNLIAQIDVGDVDLSSYYTKTKTDELLGDKANTTDLNNYVTLNTAQTITANKTFQNSCRFTNTIDGMSTITGASFVKSGADDSVVLLGAGGTKPLSEIGGSTDLSNYYTKTQTYSQQEIDGLLSYKVDNETLDGYMTTNTIQYIEGQKTFNVTLSAYEFAKVGKDDTSVLLAGGGDMLVSAFGGIEDITSTITNYGSLMVFTNTSFIKIGKLRLFRDTVHPTITLPTVTSQTAVSLDYLNHSTSDTPLIVARDTTNTIKMYVTASSSTIYVNTTTSTWDKTLEITIYGWWIAPEG